MVLADDDLAVERNNCILLGDNIGDLGMASCLDSIDNIITVGFLNDNIEARISEYMDAFDVVILDDGSMDWILDLFAKLK